MYVFINVKEILNVLIEPEITITSLQNCLNWQLFWNYANQSTQVKA